MPFSQQRLQVSTTTSCPSKLSTKSKLEPKQLKAGSHLRSQAGRSSRCRKAAETAAFTQPKGPTGPRLPLRLHRRALLRPPRHLQRLALQLLLGLAVAFRSCFLQLAEFSA